MKSGLRLSPNQAWERFRSRASKALEEELGDSLEADPSRSIELFLPSRKPHALLFFTKPFMPRGWSRLAVPPKALYALVGNGLPTAPQLRFLQQLSAQTGLPWCFIGDLDPQDLTIFVALRCGSPALRRPGRQALPFFYCGIDDPWLELCGRSLRPTRQLEAAMIRMKPLEQEHCRLIFELAPWLREVIGPRSVKLLESGMKLELEGATSPGFFRKGFDRELCEHLLSRARKAPPQ